MNNILRQIFIDNSFNELEIENPFDENVVEFWGNSNDDAINYYLVLYLDEVKGDFLINDVPEYFNSIKNIDTGYDERMDKNLSMLVCLDTTKNKETNISEVIFGIEEDPYFFKKYVITFDSSNLTQLNLILEIKDMGSNYILNKIINDTTKFISFKNNEDNTDRYLYEICTKLMIKLPFLRLEKRDEQIDDLKGIINEELQEKGLLKLKNSLLNIDENDENLIDKILDLSGGDVKC